MKEMTVTVHYGDKIPALDETRYPLELIFTGDWEETVTFRFDKPEDYMVFLQAPASMINDAFTYGLGSLTGEAFTVTAEGLTRVN